MWPTNVVIKGSGSNELCDVTRIEIGWCDHRAMLAYYAAKNSLSSQRRRSQHRHDTRRQQ
jgi:hypothetical protein